MYCGRSVAISRLGWDWAGGEVGGRLGVRVRVRVTVTVTVTVTVARGHLLATVFEDNSFATARNTWPMLAS